MVAELIDVEKLRTVARADLSILYLKQLWPSNFFDYGTLAWAAAQVQHDFQFMI